MDNPFQSPVILSLCTGMRGLERGLERAIGNITVAAYVEIEAFIIYNLVRQMEQGVVDAAPVWSDLKTFPSKQFYGKIHGIIGGYPCPGESIAGLRQLHKYEGFLWPHIRSIVNTTRPVFCFFENVAAHLTGTYPVVYRSLRKMGYAVEAGIYTAEEVGAPHERKRLFILALDDTYTGRFKEQCKRLQIKQEQPSIKQPGNEMANPNSSPAIRNLRNILFQGTENERTARREHRQWCGNEFEHCNKTVADTNSERRQLPVERQQPAEQFTQFPYPQGNYQYEWEAERAVEPGVGCTINGYNFRNDLLRMYGNGVVEQTAELAFKDLLKKHHL